MHMNADQLFAIAPCGLAVVDTSTEFRRVNEACLKLLGFHSDSQIIGKTLSGCLPKWKETPFYAALPSLLNAQMTFESIEFDVPGPRQKPLRVRAAHIPSDTGKAQGVLLMLTESLEVQQLERRLHKTEYQASLGKLARGIAHELNSPLDGVTRYVDLSLKHLRKEDEQVRGYMLNVKEGLERMVRAVKAFLEFSRQVNAPVNRIVDVNRLIDDVLLLIEHKAQFNKIHIDRQYDPELPLVPDAGLQHAILNIVKNAFDAMAGGGTLTIKTHRIDEEVLVQIKDTGEGIPESERERVFEPFFTTKPIHQGNGLGLVIAKEAVERSGGKIEFSSKLGEGTTFLMRMPSASMATQDE